LAAAWEKDRVGLSPRHPPTPRPTSSIATPWARFMRVSSPIWSPSVPLWSWRSARKASSTSPNSDWPGRLRRRTRRALGSEYAQAASRPTRPAKTSDSSHLAETSLCDGGPMGYGHPPLTCAVRTFSPRIPAAGRDHTVARNPRLRPSRRRPQRLTAQRRGTVQWFGIHKRYGLIPGPAGRHVFRHRPNLEPRQRPWAETAVQRKIRSTDRGPVARRVCHSSQDGACATPPRFEGSRSTVL